MNIETLSSSSEWMQLFRQTIDSSFGFSDATTVNTSSCVTSSSNKLSPPSSSFIAGDQYLTPKGCISKPIRKRSRASKRRPTTLLNADAKNFRSLVQQFTGCRRPSSTSISFGNPRSGSVNINFAHGKEQGYRNTCHDQYVSIAQPFIETDYSPQSQLQVQQQEEHQQHHGQVSNEEQDCEFSFDSITADHDDFFLTSISSSCSPIRSGSEIPKEFVMDDLYFLA
ncbi:hypothetical protein REPUB_Repub01dG0268600 [Reevesia pubescens]